MFIDNEFNIGDTVYLKTDPDQLPRTVLLIRISPIGLIYELSCGTDFTQHYAMELATQKDVSMVMS